ncbi:MAG: 2-hydroxyglutaryl-CoA dehydratase, partial [Deltaproteobacteria bacterium]|nr:2-hydroxyglutaryl-CoA dehydratase [Deltaproteobacteria bacterium]
MKNELVEKVNDYRDKLRQEMGLPGADVSHFKKPVERPFTKKERRHVTILCGGLTSIHDILIKGVFEGLGYRAECLPSPDNKSLSQGKEHCNRGQCNPTYYTVGNLVKYLKKLRADGVQNIEDKYIYVTAGACGACRFGMYEAEYRKALTDAGFEKFRVLTVSQTVETDAASHENGLILDRKFYTYLIKGLVIGDMINEIKFKFRPYEVNEGDTEKAVKEILDLLYNAFSERKNLFGRLREAKKILEKLKVDYSKAKPKVKIIGEFWAQTTEGDGNYGLPKWLEEEGCEVMVEPISGWLDYTVWWWKAYIKDRIRAGKGVRKKWSFISLLFKISFADFLFKFHHSMYRLALGFVNAPLPSQRQLAQLGHKYYNTRIDGGEGHLEVAKNLMAIKKKKAHLVISVKPFGCMPSTQSDGVQARVMNDYKEGLFIPIETSGDGEVNVKSRIQMKLHEAKVRAKEE